MFYFFLVIIANIALSEEIYYQVINVESHDVLNIRTQPTHLAKKIGEIPYNESCIQALQCQKSWCQIYYQYTLGWVNSYYLDFEKSKCNKKMIISNIMEIETFNQLVKQNSHQDWVQYSLLTAQKFLKDFKNQAINQSIQVNHDFTSIPSTAKVNIIFDGYRDDAIKAIHYNLTLVKQQNYWLILSAEEIFICQRGASEAYCY